ncbi:hypothetical protein [Asticcacaulis sp. YBE204]|uniref:hypothetical protein n=1 Tax=Asticcacaulis sp. YBE204 TaxID=1282363 RepID=UPI0003C40694|nr:hypothetical protein [Asticcacaulis sp. YBE204]ESQ79505.1 hypothetical protein AEYBE204_06590 [Asticcacaulis sp. YBE204]
MNIEGLSLSVLKALSKDEQDAFLAFGKPVTFRMGSATILAEFNRSEQELSVNLAHIDGGGEGVLVLLWKALAQYATDRGYEAVNWHVHALTCVIPNPRLQRFLRNKEFAKTEHPVHGPIFTFRQKL